MEPLDPARFRPSPTLTPPEAAARAGVELDYARRVFRALGLPDVPDDVVEFSEDDVEVLAALKMVLSWGYDPEDIINVARSYGFALSRVADAEVRLFQRSYIDSLMAKGLSDEELAERLGRVVPELLELLDLLIAHVHRRHLSVALQQVATPAAADQRTACVAFVDLVEFTRTVREMDIEELEGLVTRFETMALEHSVDHGASVVKMIGDAVMLASPQPDAVVGAALALVRAAVEDESLPDARAGIDHGDVAAIGGDMFGRSVNVAARLTSFARPGTVVVSQQVLDALPEPADASHIGKTKLKGAGSIRAFKVNDYPASEN